MLIKFLCINDYINTAIPPVVPELSSDDDTTHFDDIPEPDSGEEFFPTPKVHDSAMIVAYPPKLHCLTNE